MPDPYVKIRPVERCSEPPSRDVQLSVIGRVKARLKSLFWFYRYERWFYFYVMTDLFHDVSECVSYGVVAHYEITAAFTGQ